MHHFTAQIYYEDTDHSGVVYHANYLKYFERAREDIIGVDTLKKLWLKDGLGFAVYKVEMGFFEGAVFGDALDIRSSYAANGKYRTVWTQEVWRPGGTKAAVTARIEMVCIDREKNLKPTPAFLLQQL